MKLQDKDIKILSHLFFGPNYAEVKATYDAGIYHFIYRHKNGYEEKIVVCDKKIDLKLLKNKCLVFVKNANGNLRWLFPASKLSSLFVVRRNISLLLKTPLLIWNFLIPKAWSSTLLNRLYIYYPSRLYFEELSAPLQSSAFCISALPKENTFSIFLRKDDNSVVPSGSRKPVPGKVAREKEVLSCLS